MIDSILFIITLITTINNLNEKLKTIKKIKSERNKKVIKEADKTQDENIVYTPITQTNNLNFMKINRSLNLINKVIHFVGIFIILISTISDVFCKLNMLTYLFKYIEIIKIIAISLIGIYSIIKIYMLNIKISTIDDNVI